jgi:hypothetical protein
MTSLRVVAGAANGPGSAHDDPVDCPAPATTWTDPLGVLGTDIDYRTVELCAAHVGCIEEAAAELRRLGFLLLPGMLDRVAARWHAAGGEAA